MGFFVKIVSWYKKTFWSLEKQAVCAGVKMGRNNYIATRFWGSEPYLITIGSNCQLTKGAFIHTHGGGVVARPIIPDFDVFGKVVIGDWVYIGSDAKIMPGVTIGNNVLVAAGSVVTKSIPSNVVVAGNPARYICTVEEYIERNRKYNVSSSGMSYRDKKQFLMSLDDAKFIKKMEIKVEK